MPYKTLDVISLFNLMSRVKVYKHGYWPTISNYKPKTLDWPGLTKNILSGKLLFFKKLLWLAGDL